MNTLDSGSRADPYAGVILAGPCFTDCPMCSTINAPPSESMDESVGMVYADPPFSHLGSLVGAVPTMPSLRSMGDVGMLPLPTYTAALQPTCYNPLPDDLPEDSDDWCSVVLFDFAKSDLDLWPSPSSSTTPVAREDPVVTPALQHTPPAASPDLRIVQPIPQYPRSYRSNDYNKTAYNGEVDMPPLLRGIPNLGNSPPHPALDNGDSPRTAEVPASVSLSTTAHPALEAASTPRRADLGLHSPQPAPRLARWLARCRAAAMLSTVASHAFSAFVSTRSISGVCSCGCLVARRAVQELSRGKGDLDSLQHLLCVDCRGFLSQCVLSHAWKHPYSGRSHSHRISSCAHYSRRLGVSAS